MRDCRPARHGSRRLSIEWVETRRTTLRTNANRFFALLCAAAALTI